MARFHLDPAAWGETAVLAGEEARHAIRVLRLRVGDRITVFDGAGRSAPAQVLSLSKETATLRLGTASQEPPPAVEIVLAQAVLKGKAMDLLLQKSVELGVHVIQPLVTRHAVVQPGEGKEDKWRRIVLEACKQCGRSRVPEVRPVREFDGWLGEASAGLRLIASLAPGAPPMRQRVAAAGSPERAVVLVGPEGDFSEEETALARAAGFEPVRLGGPVLRSETAALYCLAALNYALF
jgi:16S rRNA (uracil1498-N3)-methyltransferase